MSMKKENKNLKRGKRQQINKKRNPNEPRVLEFNLSKSILVLLIIGMIIGVITTARIIITINEAKQNKALATEEGKNSERVNWVTSSDGIEVPVPKGYVASQIEGETSVNGGFVIYEDTAEGINWNTILGTIAASTLSLDEKTETTTKAKAENNNEATNKSETENNSAETNKTESTNKNVETNNNETTNKNDITNNTEKETNSESTKETEEKKSEDNAVSAETESTKEESTKIEGVEPKEEEVKPEEKTGTAEEKVIDKEQSACTNKEVKNEEMQTNTETEKTTSEDNIVSAETEETKVKETTTEVQVDAKVQVEEAGIQAMAENTALNIYNLQKSTNQYVWVPVNNISRIYGVDSEGRLWGKLYDVSSSGRSKSNWTETNEKINITSKTGYREPDVTHYNTDLDIDSKLQGYLYGETQYELLSDELEEHFIKTIESIKKYGGFYIGRYETGGLNGTAVVRKMDTNIASQTWYTMYKRCKELKGENGNVITSMIWGNLWDETLQWLVESGATNSAGTTLTYSLVGSNSSSWGNYKDSNTFNYIPAGSTTGEATGTKANSSGTRIPTGSSEYTKANNIYDLAGNVWDWTLEANSTAYRVYRGGSYNNNGDSYPADYRSNCSPAYSFNYSGCRAALLIE